MLQTAAGESSGTWVARPRSMSSPEQHEDVPGLEGPDYVALVIEWDDDADVATIVRTTEPSHAPFLSRKIAAVMGALIALGFATWGLRRLRTS
jgi:hypothetical protein